MRVFSRHTFEFQKFETTDDVRTISGTAITRQNDFVEVPDWVKETWLFKAAKDDGSIVVVESSAEEKAVELGAAVATGNKVKTESLLSRGK